MTDDAAALLSYPVLKIVFRLFGGRGSQPSQAHLDAFRAQAQVCDPVADALVAAMRRPGGRIGRAQFEQALEHGLETVQDPLPELVDFFAELERLPFWVDFDQLDVAGRAVSRVPMSTLVPLMVALSFPMSYVSARVNEVLRRGGDLDKRAGARLTETLAWFIHCTSPGGMRRFGDGFKTTARVRLMHGFVRAGIESLDDWDAETLGRPINQTHQTVTMVPITGVALVTPLLGHLANRKERDAVLHLMRYMSHVMGVSPDLQVTTVPELIRLIWLAGASEIGFDQASKDLTSAVFAAIPEMYGLPDSGLLAPVLRQGYVDFHAALARLALGSYASGSLGVPAVGLGALAVVPWVAGNFANDVVRLAVPGESGRRAARGHRARLRALEEMSARVRTRPFTRDDAVETVAANDAAIRAAGGRAPVGVA